MPPELDSATDPALDEVHQTQGQQTPPTAAGGQEDGKLDLVRANRQKKLEVCKCIIEALWSLPRRPDAPTYVYTSFDGLNRMSPGLARQRCGPF